VGKDADMPWPEPGRTEGGAQLARRRPLPAEAADDVAQEPVQLLCGLVASGPCAHMRC